MKPLLLSIIFFGLMPLFCFAWEGFDYDSGHYIDTSSERGKDIKFYDYSDGKYHRGEVLSSGLSGYKLEIFDYETGKVRNFDMERK